METAETAEKMETVEKQSMPQQEPPYQNPFTPSFGEAPLFMAGRSQLLNTYARAIRQPNRAPELTTLVSGARGSGKTSLLLRMCELAEEQGWIVAQSTCLPGLLEDIYVQARDAAKSVLGKKASRHVTGVGIGSLVSLDWEQAEHMPTTWRSQMAEILDALAEHDTGLVISVDEVRPQEPEMIRLASVYQHFVGEHRRVSLLMAGLPFNISNLLQDSTVSFLRRAPRHRIGRVADFEVEQALRRTVETGGRAIEEDALQWAVRTIEGLPFMLQLVGYRSWEVHPTEQNISLADVQEGSRIAGLQLKDQVLDSTYRELSDGDIAFLVAMLPDKGGESAIADIARRMGKSSGYVNSYRRRMLELGVIGERRRRVVGFDLPGFAEYLAERAEEDGLL